MLRFAPGVHVKYFNRRLSDVLEYASAWGILSRIVVDVNSIDDKAHGARSLHQWSLAVDLDTDGDRSADLQRLHGFLARYLPPEYDVVLEQDHVHVEFDAKRRPAQIDPPAIIAGGAAAV